MLLAAAAATHVSPAGAARSSSCPTIATARSSRPRSPAASPPTPSCATTPSRAVAGALRRVPAHARGRAVHRHRQPLGGVRAGRRPRPRRAVGRRRPAARRAAQPRACTRATPRCCGRSSTAAPSCSPGTRAPPMSSGSSRSGWVREVPAARRAQPARRAQRDPRGRVARRARAVRGLRRRARGARRRAGARAGRAARATPRSWCAPSAGTPPAARTAAGRCTPRARAPCPSAPGAVAPRTPGRARTARRPACAWPPSGSERTADELGRAFPGTRVDRRRRRPPGHRTSTRARRSSSRRAAPSRSPSAAIARSSCSTAIGCCSPTTCASASRACGGGRTPPPSPHPARPCTSSASRGAVARALATWTQAAYARAELADRAPLRMPPTVRVAALEGASARRRRRPRRAARGGARARRRGRARPARARRDAVRALVRFDYALGAKVTESLRASVVSQARSRGRRPAKGRTPGARNTLRVRVDVPDLDL